jgi:hypothetical protein
MWDWTTATGILQWRCDMLLGICYVKISLSMLGTIAWISRLTNSIQKNCIIVYGVNMKGRRRWDMSASALRVMEVYRGEFSNMQCYYYVHVHPSVDIVVFAIFILCVINICVSMCPFMCVSCVYACLPTNVCSTHIAPCLCMCVPYMCMWDSCGHLYMSVLCHFCIGRQL